MRFLRCVCQIFIDGRLLKYLSIVFIYRIYLSTESIFMCLAAALLVALPIFPTVSVYLTISLFLQHLFTICLYKVSSHV